MKTDWLSYKSPIAPLPEGWTNSVKFSFRAPHGISLKVFSRWDYILTSLLSTPNPAAINLLWDRPNIKSHNHKGNYETQFFWVSQSTCLLYSCPVHIYFVVGLMFSFGQQDISKHNANRGLISLHALGCIFSECSSLEPRRVAQPTWRSQVEEK